MEEITAVVQDNKPEKGRGSGLLS